MNGVPVVGSEFFTCIARRLGDVTLGNGFEPPVGPMTHMSTCKNHYDSIMHKYLRTLVHVYIRLDNIMSHRCA